MSRVRLAAVAVTLCCGLLLLGGTGIAAAQSRQPLGKSVAVTGKVTRGKTALAATASRFTGRLSIARFYSRAGKLFAVGTLKGRVANRSFTQTVRFRVSLPGAARARSAQIPPTPNACTILTLTLQPLDLNLLGLRVRTSVIDVLIEGVRGPGNLLGNLLCGLTGILNPPTVATLNSGQVARVLNAILALSRPATA